RPLEPHQPDHPPREHPADPSARRPDPVERRGSSRGRGRAPSRLSPDSAVRLDFSAGRPDMRHESSPWTSRMMADDTTPAPEGANGAENIEEAAQPTADERLAQAAREVAEAKDRVLRTLAEMENLRRRTEREIADAKSYSVAAFARDMLTVADNLKRAIAAVPAEA